MTTVDELTLCLEDGLAHSSHLARNVQEFQHAVWEATDRADTDNAAEWQILEDLAHELTKFVPDKSIRREDPAYYGSLRACGEIDRALARLSELRAHISPG